MSQYVYNKHNTTWKVLCRYLHTRCFCIRNLTRSLRSLVRFLIRQQLVRKYRTPALSMKYSLHINSARNKYFFRKLPNINFNLYFHFWSTVILLSSRKYAFVICSRLPFGKPVFSIYNVVGRILLDLKQTA